MEAILDSSFIVSCLKRKIDFISELARLGFEPIIPREVLQELKDLKMKSPHAERIAIEIAFEMFEKIKIKHIGLGKKKVDEGLIEKGKEGIFIATLDNGVKRNVPNKIIISNASNSLKIERD